MFKKIKPYVKTGVIITIFAGLVTLLFVTSIFWLEKKLTPTTTEKTGVYVLSSTDYSELLENSGSLQIDTDKIVNHSNFQLLDTTTLWQNFIPICLIFVIVLIILLLCLWLILRFNQNKRIIKIAKEMRVAPNKKVLSDEPMLTAAYEMLKYRFDAQLNDYKRLNTYLSHEQKNELAILRTNLELSESREYLNVIDNIAGSIDDILTLSENNDEDPLSSVDVLLICAEVHDNYSKLSDNIYFHFDDDDAEIIAKSRWIYRAVANLLDNAIKYGEGKPIELSVRVKKGSVIIMVKDHGIGIEKAKQDLIFNDHYRINELNKAGYGIGLSLVSHVCDLCGGFVMVESDLGSGASFYVSFPQKLF